MAIMPGIVINQIEIFFLIFIRITGLFVVSPIFGRRNIPVRFKIAFSLMVALILVNVVKVNKSFISESVFSFTAVIAKEFLIGLTLGYVAYLIFTAIHLAGQIIDMQIGFGAISVIDPVSNIQVPVSANFYYILTMMVFLILNGHHMLITGIYRSFELVPMGEALFGNELLGSIIKIVGDVFVIAFKISTPVIASILIADIALGVISKSVPQLNVFVVGMPLKIILGLVIMIICIPVLISFVEFLMKMIDGQMYEFMKGMWGK